jgi:hypothetical protein
MAPTAMAVAMCDLPTPGGPISSTPSWAWTNRALALGFGDLRIEGPVEIGQGFHNGDAGLFEAAREEPIGASGELILDEQFEKLQMRERRRLGLRDASWERVDHSG